MADQLNVIGLISGGKDSFFSLLHCLQHGHRLVALANLSPAAPSLGDVDGTTGASTSTSEPKSGLLAATAAYHPEDAAFASGRAVALGAAHPDLDSWMYQSAGHQIIPLYAAAIGVPLYVRPVVGKAIQQGRDYAAPSRREVDQDPAPDNPASSDETESMISLLQYVKAQHPEANAVSSGAILSTYQRTRVESVAVRLGLVPLAYLWKYTTLPRGRRADSQQLASLVNSKASWPSGAPESGQAQSYSANDHADLLRDMEASGLDARVVKVASGGLDSRDLWRNVATGAWVQRAKSRMAPFGIAEGSLLGEGGEFETVVLGGPTRLFRSRVVVPPEGRVVHERGEEAWLTFTAATLEPNDLEARGGRPDGDVVDREGHNVVRVPDLLDSRFESILQGVALPDEATALVPPTRGDDSPRCLASETSAGVVQWAFHLDDDDGTRPTIEAEMATLVERIHARLMSATESAPPVVVTNTTILLRSMTDFATINSWYGSLFPRPNPPSRVTISCGDLLPLGRRVAIYLTAQSCPRPSARQGLHVQSRSYWAPANIGPYSQAIEVPMLPPAAASRPTPQGGASPEDPAEGEGAAIGPRLVSVAGQIPLVPATMALPDESDGTAELPLVLALQHLWRIGEATGVQFWSSCVAFFPRQEGREDMARLAGRAERMWVGAHVWSRRGEGAAGDEDGEEEDENGDVDPWDRKYNALFAGKDTQPQTERVCLPDWTVAQQAGLVGQENLVPPFFAAEVETLPRGAPVEYHANLGFSKLEENSLRLFFSSSDVAGETDPLSWLAWMVTVDGGQGRRFVHHVTMVLAQERRCVIEDLTAANRLAAGGDSLVPSVLYFDTGLVESRIQKYESGCVVVPCRSLWASGKRLVAVVVSRAVFEAGL